MVDQEGRINEDEERKQINTFNNLLVFPSALSRRSTTDAIGNSFKQHFCGAGIVLWQWKYLWQKLRLCMQI